MEILSEISNLPARDAATLVMLRDSPVGMEVFLVKRHGLSDVLGGAYVFPGGKLDTADSQLDTAVHLDQDTASLHRMLGEPQLASSNAAGLYVAALREAFEESGVLFADNATAATASAATQLLKDGLSFNEMLARLALRLQTQAVAPWSRWITPLIPSVSSKRFDTRFFVSALPAHQEASHDNVETTESVWLPPRTALEQYRDGQIELAPPQIMSLAHLSRHSSVHSVMSQARAALPAVVFPEAFDEDGERVVCYPGDPRHSNPQRALPGPTRLIHRKRKFVPVDGFEALFQ